MLTTKKVIEEAIKVRKAEIDFLRAQEKMIAQSPVYFPDKHLLILADIENFESQIAELKQSLQIIYDANNNK